MIPVAILCGGKGTRLAPLTDGCPKCLVDVHGRPFLLWQLELLKRHGYTDIVLLTGHLWEQIAVLIGDGSALGMSVHYSQDAIPGQGPDAAILQARPLLGELFFVLYGDSYLECSYARLEGLLREFTRLDAVLTFYDEVDYGIRAFRNFPAESWLAVPMTQRWEEIGTPEGLERVKHALAR